MAEGRHTTNPKDYRKGGRDRRGCHVEIERSFEIRRHRDRDRIGANRGSLPPKGATCFGERPESAVASPIIPSRIAIIG